MFLSLQNRLRAIIEKSVARFFSDGSVPIIDVEIPADKVHGEYSSNIALKSSKILKRPPMEIAGEFREAIVKLLQDEGLSDTIGKVDILKPGFINFMVSPTALWGILKQTLVQGSDYGQSDFGKKQKINIEFVSANPTGPLSVAHARQAAVGDALANIFNFIGFAVTREYYVNDEGNQINILGKSVYLRALERLGEKPDFTDECYQGSYLFEMADTFLKDRNIRSVETLKNIAQDEIRLFAVQYLLTVIKGELSDFGVNFDVWSYQSQVAGDAKILQTFNALKAQGHIYEKEGAFWFKTTEYGDDKDRVVKKSDGSYTYFMPDIVYHQDKFQRGFEKVFNLWGPDHHGYIPRLTAAVQALGKPKEVLQVLIIQLATLYRKGQPVKMSTRVGQYVTLREVIEDVGVDAARFFFLMRLIDAHLDFDLELAKKESPENPVYYIQYAHARTYAIEEKAKEIGLDVQKGKDFKLLAQEEELDLIKKLGHFPRVLHMCWRQTDAFALVNYLQELAATFHRFYDRHRVLDNERPELSLERLSLVLGTRVVIANGLRLLGVSRPKRM